MAYRVKVTRDFGKALREGSIEIPLFNIIKEAARLKVVPFYVKEAPVDKGELRKRVRVIASNFREMSATVSTDAKSNGKPYPLFVHEGTGALKGTSDQGYTTGRVRAGDVARGIGGIRPNKFATRAAEKARPVVVRFAENEISKLIKKR